MQVVTVPAAGSASVASPVTVEDLVKRYPKRPVNAVDGVTFDVHHGEVFGLLGPNGAGKTTTVGVLTTRVKPTSGRATVAGIDVTRDPVTARRRIGVVPQRSNLDRSLSARQNLLFHAAYHGIPAEERRRRANVLLEQFGLVDRADDKVDFFSGGPPHIAAIDRKSPACRSGGHLPGGTQIPRNLVYSLFTKGEASSPRGLIDVLQVVRPHQGISL